MVICQVSATGIIWSIYHELARIWNVDPAIIPHWSPPTHAMEIFRYCEKGSIKMLWISATNPAVSMPNLPSIRRILEKNTKLYPIDDGHWNATAVDIATDLLVEAIDSLQTTPMTTTK